MNQRLCFGDVLCNSVSDARFLVIDSGTAVRMPALDGIALLHGKPQPCSKLAHSAAECELQGGRRYVDPTTGLTLLCIWPGRGSLRYDGKQMTPDDDMCEQLTPAAATPRRAVNEEARSPSTTVVCACQEIDRLSRPNIIATRQVLDTTASI
jgi:hypothetical protein